MWCIDPRKETGETPQPARKRHPRREEKGGSNSLTSNKENQAPHCPEEGGQGELKPKSRGECKPSSPTFSRSTGSIALKGRAAIVLSILHGIYSDILSDVGTAGPQPRAPNVSGPTVPTEIWSSQDKERRRK